MSDFEKRFYSRKELEAVLGVSGPTIDRRLRDGTLQFTRLGRRILIPCEAVDALIAQARPHCAEER